MMDSTPELPELTLTRRLLEVERKKCADLEEICRNMKSVAVENPDVNWLRELKKRAAADWDGPPLVVLSLFDGLGAIWQALHDLGIPFIGFSSEIDPHAIKVVSHRWPGVTHLGSVTEVVVSRIPCQVDLVVGGFPCQDLSAMNRFRVGLHGPRSSLFFHLLRVLQDFKPSWFVVENVMSMTWVDREEITKYLGVRPIEIDSADLTPQARKRYFWTNVPLPKRIPAIANHPSTFLQSCLNAGAMALNTKSNCVMLTNHWFGKGGMKPVLCEKTFEPRPMDICEVERMFGLPDNYTSLAGARRSRKKSREVSGSASGEASGPPGGSQTSLPKESQQIEDPGPIGRVTENSSAMKSVICLSDSEPEGEIENNGGIAQYDCPPVKFESLIGSEFRSTAREAAEGSVAESAADWEGSPAERELAEDRDETTEGNSVRRSSRKKTRVDSYSEEAGSEMEEEDEPYFMPRRKLKSRKSVLARVAMNEDWKMRWKLLGNSFSVQVVAYVLSGLVNKMVRMAAMPTVLPDVVPQNVSEEKCAVMQPGELWAIYNEETRPNWYAFVVSRSGERFSSTKDEPLNVQLHYLEFINSYGKYEEDWMEEHGTGGWRSCRGAGVYRLSELFGAEHNSQTTFLSFSHRVTSYVQLREKTYFVYPAKDTVWTMVDESKMLSWVVFIKDSSFDIEEVRKEEVGKEGFKAVVCPLVHLGRGNVYKKIEKSFVVRDLAKFSFESPYYFKNDESMFIIEPHSMKVLQYASEEEVEDSLS